MRMLQYSPVAALLVILAACGGSHRNVVPTTAQEIKERSLPPRIFLAPVPGRINRHITQSNIQRTVCVRGYTRTVRPPQWYTTKLKKQQMEQYHLGGTIADYEEDHLIPLSLGGSPADPQNLWPEPHPRSYEVDKIEFGLYQAVCNYIMTLKDARRVIRTIKHTEG